CRNKFLNQSSAIDAEVDLSGVNRTIEFGRGFDTHDTCASSADVRLYNSWEADGFRMLLQLLDAIDHPRARKRDAQRVQQRELRCFRDLVAEGFAPVDNTRPGALDACEEISREKYRLSVSSQVSGRTHPVEKQSVPDGSYCVVRMGAGIELCVSNPAAVELRK